METAGELLGQHGAWVLFGGVLAEQLGLPFPALPLLVAAGVLVGTGHLSWSGALVAAISGALLADVIWFFAGRWRGRPVLTLLCRIALEPDACVRRTEDVFRRYGVRSLLVVKFIPGLSTIAPPLAGIVGLGLPLFLLYDALGAVVWAGRDWASACSSAGRWSRPWPIRNRSSPRCCSQRRSSCRATSVGRPGMSAGNCRRFRG